MRSGSVTRGIGIRYLQRRTVNKIASLPAKKISFAPRPRSWRWHFVCLRFMWIHRLCSLFNCIAFPLQFSLPTWQSTTNANASLIPARTTHKASCRPKNHLPRKPKPPMTGTSIRWTLKVRLFVISPFGFCRNSFCSLMIPSFFQECVMKADETTFLSVIAEGDLSVLQGIGVSSSALGHFACNLHPDSHTLKFCCTWLQPKADKARTENTIYESTTPRSN